MQALKKEQNNSAVKKALFCLFVSIVFFLGSCSNEEQTPSAPSQATAKKNAAKTDKEETHKDKGKNTTEENKLISLNEYSYNPSGKVDPFTPLISETAPSEQTQTPNAPAPAAKVKKDVPLTPLQKFDISDFTLVAVISTPQGAKALIEDPTTSGFVVKEGMIIGKNDGIIKKILKNSMLIEEKIVDPQGNPDIKISTLNLKKK